MRAKMRKLRISTFADVYYSLIAEETFDDALPEEIFLAAVDRADEQRTQRNIIKAINHAHFRYPQASLADIITPEVRNINIRKLKRIAATNWREDPTPIHILAPSGTGKTYIACAIGIHACHNGYSVAYHRLDQIIDELAAFPPSDRLYQDKIRKLTNVDVLIIDDFLTIRINQRGQEDLSKILLERDGRLPTIISSQSTPGYWIKVLPDPVNGETVVNRIRNARRIELNDYDIRSHLTKARLAQDED